MLVMTPPLRQCPGWLMKWQSNLVGKKLDVLLVPIVNLLFIHIEIQEKLQSEVDKLYEEVEDEECQFPDYYAVQGLEYMDKVWNWHCFPKFMRKTLLSSTSHDEYRYFMKL